MFISGSVQDSRKQIDQRKNTVKNHIIGVTEVDLVDRDESISGIRR